VACPAGGNLGISAILVSALRVGGFGVNFLCVWVLFYCFYCYYFCSYCFCCYCLFIIFELFVIRKVTEKLYHIEDKIKVNKIKIIIEVLGYFSSHLGEIFVNTFHEHTIFLVRAIVDNYLNTRIKYKCRNTSNDKEYIRNSHTKQIHFRGQ
jgi:hypothetical protein